MKRPFQQRLRARLGMSDHSDAGGSVDRGDTLIELLIAIALIGLTAAGILGGLAAALGSSGTHRTLTNLDAIVRSFVETSRYEIQNQAGSQTWALNGTLAKGPMFAPCASTGLPASGDSTAAYPLTSAPYPTSGPVNSLVTVFGSGFFDAAHISVTLASVSSPTVTKGAFIHNKSIVNGYLTVTFFVPNVAGAQTIEISDGSTKVTTVDAGGNFTVTPGNPSGVATTMSQYQVGISAIQYLITTNPSTPSSSSTFTSDQPTCQGDTNRADQVQMLTVTATAPDGERDQLNFTVADPGFILPPTTLNLSVVPTPPAVATQGNTLTFTADLTPVAAPAPTGTITWTWLQAPKGTLACPPSTVPSAAPLDVTCTVKDAAAGQYQLDATYSGDAKYALTTAVPLSIHVWPPTQLQFQTQPSGAVDGKPLSVQPAVQVLDANGDLENSNNDYITLALTNSPPGASLICAGGTTTVQAKNGIASFSGCTITGSTASPPNPYTLTATDTTEPPPQVTNATSNPITLGVGLPNHLVFTTQPPASATDGATWGGSVQVTIEDVGNNRIPKGATGSTDKVTLQQPPGSTLTCTGPGGTSHNASNGVATFSSCSLTGSTGVPPSTYTLTATDNLRSLSVTSTDITLNLGPAVQLAFTTQPPATPIDGATWPVEVSVEDVGGNAINGNTDSITLNPQPGFTCTSGLTQTASNGVASFSGCSIIGNIANPYTLTATDSTDTSLGTATSDPITLGLGNPTQLAFTTQPPATPIDGATWPVEISVEDVGGNAVTGNTDSITLNPQPGFTCTSGLTQTASNGVASFSGCSITGSIANPYTLTATDSTAPPPQVTNATSGPITLKLGSAAKLVFTTKPSSGPSGFPWATQPVVTIEDIGGNTVTTSTDTVTLAITSPLNGAQLACSGAAPSVAAVAGVATFSGCEITTGLPQLYTVGASDPPLTPAMDTVEITP